MTHNPTLAAFQCLRAFAANENASPLDRLTTANAAAWLAHATSYGITAEARLLCDLADSKKNPVERATPLIRALVQDLSTARLPLCPPFQAVDLLYSTLVDEEISSIELNPTDPFQSEIQRGPQP